MLSDNDIQDVTTNAVRAGKLSWLGFEQDEQGGYSIPALSPSNFQFARAIESAACAERDARIAELERLRSEDHSHALDLAAEIERMTQQLAEARKDAERWKAHISSGDSHSHTCRKCGHSYTPDDSDTEDCPRCGFDGADEAIKEQTS